MILKNIFFIWFGDKPHYVDYCINAFKKANTLFQIRTFFYKSINNTKNQDIEECLIACLRKNTFYNSWINRLYYKNQCKCENAKWSDVLRWYLLNKYGGIYLDCDTWPIKPFDEQLLNKNSFFVTRIDEKYFYRDSFFMGFNKGFLDNLFINTNFIDFNLPEKEILISENIFLRKLRIKMSNNIFNYCIPENINENKQYNENKLKFLNSTLLLYSKYLSDLLINNQYLSFLENYYIDHFFIKSWK